MRDDSAPVLSATITLFSAITGGTAAPPAA
jgi:hypothetical protein